MDILRSFPIPAKNGGDTIILILYDEIGHVQFIPGMHSSKMVQLILQYTRWQNSWCNLCRVHKVNSERCVINVIKNYLVTLYVMVHIW